MNRSLQIIGFLSVSFLLAPVFPGTASAQSSFYKYVDRNGKVFFTDRLEAIPEAYRDQVKTYREEKEKTEAAPPAAGPESIAGQKEAAGRDPEAEKAAKERETKARQEKENRIADLQNQIRAKQEEQRNLRTTWMVYDRIKLNQLNAEIASLEERVRSLQKELSAN